MTTTLSDNFDTVLASPARKEVQIKVRLHENGYAPISTSNGDWLDLAVPEDIHLSKYEFKIVPLNISIELPPNTEAHIVSRSSTFKRYHVVQANGIGIIDNSYNGDDDIWCVPLLAMEDTFIPAGTRISQFRIYDVQPKITMNIVPVLGNENRGGFGSTGV